MDDANWMSPSEKISDDLAASMVLIASIICGEDKETTVRELELWKETVGVCPHGTLAEMKERLVLWRHRMEEEGLEQPDPGFEKFVRDGVELSGMAGHDVPECLLAVMRNELSVDSIWRKVVAADEKA